MNLGYLYVANKSKFIDEAIISSKSLRRFTNLPIAIVCTAELYNDKLDAFFDKVVVNNTLNEYTYLSKIIGMQSSPFEGTVFLDSDTFVCSDISNLFDLMDLVDIATTSEVKIHTKELDFIKYKNLIPEFNSGVIFFKKNSVIEKLLKDWLKICIDNKLQIDMPGLREAILANFKNIKFVILPEEYNSHGYKSMLILNGEVKVIHERLGTQWNITTPYFLPFEKALIFSKKINKYHFKRLYIPYVGIIPYYYSPWNIVFKIKKMLGIKRISKNK